MKYHLFFVVIFLLMMTRAFAQRHVETKLTGRVISSSSKKSLSGTTVRVRGRQNVSFTNNNGLFSIARPSESDTLVFSHIGYHLKVLPMDQYNKKDSIIEMVQKENALNEVVVSTGYQNIPKERATGSYDFIDRKMLNQQVGTNILDRIKGVASGVLFRVGKKDNSSTNIAIRGASTINGPQDPLIVLDGFIYEGDITNINPNDIENITILKDAAATSIWGARAGNGVIVINTKKGHFNQKMQVGFSAGVIVHSKPDLFNLPQISSSDYVDVEQFLFNKGYFNNTINQQYLALTPAVEVFLNGREGLISTSDSATQINALKNTDSRKQYLKYFYTHAITQQYAINIHGGSKKYTYKFSGAYDKNLSDLFAKSRKINLGITNRFKPIRNLKIDMNVYYTNEKDKSGRPGFNNITIGSRHVPYLSFRSDSGKALPVATTYRGTYTDTLADGKLLDWKNYPLEDWKHSVTTIRKEELYTNLGLQYQFTSFLNIDLKYQYQRQQTDQEQLFDEQSYHARDMINQFTQFDPSSGSLTYVVPLGGIRMLNHGYVASNTLRGQLNFNYGSGKNMVAAIVGGEIRQLNKYGDNSIVYGYNADPIKQTRVDFVNYYPTLPTGGYRNIEGNFTSYNTVNRFASFYMNASYTYNKRYILSASARKDAANIFGLNTNDKWEPLWSAGIAWKISDESFYNMSLFPQLKLRATYGFNGNIDPSKTAQATGDYRPEARYTNYPYLRIQTINNPDLKWEKNRMINIGIDFTSQNDILSGSIEYYKKKGSDLYGYVPIDYTTGGWTMVIKNVADMKGKGLDVTLNSNNINRVFKWNTRFLFNYHTDKTTKYYISSANELGSKLGSGTGIVPVIGKPLFAIAAYKWGGLDAEGNPQGIVNGEKNTDYKNMSQNGDIVYVGPSTPTVFGSLINTFSWKGITLSANIGFKTGYYFKRPTLSYTTLVQSGVGTKDYADRWKKPGDEATTNVPSFIYPVADARDEFYQYAEVNVLKADNIRLQYVNISYSLGKTLSKRLHFSDLQIYVNMANMGILWKANKEGLNPEYPSSIPPERTYAVGIKANL